jgi:ribosome recycling factor
MDIITNYKSNFGKTIEHFKEEIHSLRSGRASAALVENINVMAYGVLARLKNIASIMVIDSKTLKIEPWDKNIIKEVEKGIIDSQTGLNPQNEGSFLRIALPSMTEENRKEIIRVLNQKTETVRIALRQIRDEIRNEVIRNEEAKEITEDEKFRLFKEIDDLVNSYNQEVKMLAQEKEKEILTI